MANPFLQMQIKCAWSACNAEFEDKKELIPHLSNLHMSANHLKPTENLVVCKWKTCSSKHSVQDLIGHISKSHLFSAEESVKPNTCFWKDCLKAFGTFEELTEHAADEHVGARLNSYICKWQNCERKEKPFAQRQKMMRHLQTHTGIAWFIIGDKPYECVLCLQKFADALSMNQHKKTHTGI